MTRLLYECCKNFARSVNEHLFLSKEQLDYKTKQSCTNL